MQSATTAVLREYCSKIVEQLQERVERAWTRGSVGDRPCMGCTWTRRGPELGRDSRLAPCSVGEFRIIPRNDAGRAITSIAGHRPLYEAWPNKNEAQP